MQKTLFALSLGIAGFLLASHATQARQAQCAERDTIIEALAERYGESRQGIGLAENNGIVEVFVSAATGTWTILFTSPSGMTCLVASGSHYEAVEDPGKPVGEAA